MFRSLLLAGWLVLPGLALAQSGNLIAGGTADAARCANDRSAVTTLPGWTIVQGAPAAICSGFAPLATPGQSGRGRGFFANAPYGDSAATQVIDIAAAAPEISRTSRGRYFACTVTKCQWRARYPKAQVATSAA